MALSNALGHVEENGIAFLQNDKSEFTGEVLIKVSELTDTGARTFIFCMSMNI